MINGKEKMVPSVEEEEMQEDEKEEEMEKDEEEEATSSDNEEEEEERVGEREAGPSSSEEKEKPSDVLNLNNEVVKMRKEVKRVKALIIRKLTRQIAALKKKKGNEAETGRNQRRAARLLEEVHSMKKLPPDLVTKTALQKNLNFEQVCKNPKSSISDRAVARIATHPQFSKKIDNIKAAIKAFKEERMRAAKQGGHPKGQKQPEKATQLSPDTRQGRKNEEKGDGSPVKQRMAESEKGVGAFKGDKKPVTQSPASPDVHGEKRPAPAGVESTLVERSVKPTPQSKHKEKRSGLPSAPRLVHSSADEEESDVESSDGEEKEYFDDSTEERFHKQSSQSEESDEDDFFLGKVSKFKKKKKKEMSGEGEEEAKGKKDSVSLESNKLQRELDELESRLKSKATPLQSYFCSSLAGAKGGRSGDKGKGAGKPAAGRGPDERFSKPAKFRKHENRTSDSGSKFSVSPSEGRRPKPDRTESGSAGRGREDVRKQGDRRGGGFISHQPPQPALHPSWEASKKRKEQQGQILAFQGKKIKFDDDD